MIVRPLDGIRVLDLAWAVAGPAIGRVLADYGATVVRVESSQRIDTARMIGPFPGGKLDPQRSSCYDTFNAGKLGVVLDLGKEEGKAVARDLALWSDVLIESFAPGQMARWGLSPEALLALNPELVCLSTSLMGQTGPYASLGGYGNTGAALAGFQGIVGMRGAQPVGPFGPYTDFVGPRFALVALLAALEHRRVTGEGCWIDVSQAEAGVQFLAAEIAQGATTGKSAEALGNRDPRFAPHGVFPCFGDDQWIAIVTRDDKEWLRLAELIGGKALDSAFRTLAGRMADEDQLEQIVACWTVDKNARALEAMLQEARIPAHKVSEFHDVIDDPQLATRDQFVRMPHPLGGVDSVFDASRYRLSETPAIYDRTAPHFGRDTLAVLSDVLGYDAEQIAALEAAGVLQ